MNPNINPVQNSAIHPTRTPAAAPTTSAKNGIPKSRMNSLRTAQGFLNSSAIFSSSAAGFPEAHSAPTNAPMLEPAIMSIGIFSRSITLSTPICARPSAAPEPSARPTSWPPISRATRRTVRANGVAGWSIRSFSSIGSCRSFRISACGTTIATGWSTRSTATGTLNWPSPGGDNWFSTTFTRCSIGPTAVCSCRISALVRTMCSRSGSVIRYTWSDCVSAFSTCVFNSTGRSRST